MKINFQQFKIPTDVTRKQFAVADVRESVANLLYLNVNGIRAHALAMKIFTSEGDTEYTHEEAATLTSVTEKLGTPAFIDGLREQLNNQS